jgi:hypothetical protein
MNTRRSGMVRWGLGLVGVVVSSAACSAPPGAYGAEREDTPSGASNAGNLLPALPGANDMPAGTTTNTAPAAPPATAVSEAPLPMNVVLEDFADGDARLSSGSFAGSWRTYSDGTGQVTPPVNTDIVPVNGAVQVTGSGFGTWGVGLTVDLNNPAGQRQPADLSAYRGLSIRARGTGTIAVELVTPATTGTAEGGSCTGETCFGHYAGSLVLGAEYADRELLFTSLSQPTWGQPVSLDLKQVLAINFLARADGGPVGIDLSLEGVTLLAPLPPLSGTPGSVAGGSPGTGELDGSNPFAGRTLHSDGGAAQAAYSSAQGAERDLRGKVAQNPTAFWLTGGDPGQAGSIAGAAGANYPVLVAYNIPNRDCSGESAGGAGSPEEYQGWIDGMSSALSGKQAAVILEPDALAQSCGASTESLIAYAVTSLRRNPGVAVYIDGGHSNWVAASQMATRLRSAGIEQATGFAINVSNFQPTQALIGYGHSLSDLWAASPS